MIRHFRIFGVLSVCAAGLAMGSGCDGSGGDDPNAPPVAIDAGAPGPGPGPGPGGPGGPGGEPGKKGRSSPIRTIMNKLNGRGPNALQTLIGSELKVEQPAWETIQPQTKEYAQLAADLAKHDPPKGSKESWAKFVEEYAGFATELDKAAQAKDKTKATEAHEDLASSCNACHRQHRGGPGMMGGPGMGGRPGFGRPGGGGPPAGGPGGGPPPGGPQGAPPVQQKND
jgi:hypothetical protein